MYDEYFVQLTVIIPRYVRADSIKEAIFQAKKELKEQGYHLKDDHIREATSHKAEDTFRTEILPHDE